MSGAGVGGFQASGWVVLSPAAEQGLLRCLECCPAHHPCALHSSVVPWNCLAIPSYLLVFSWECYLEKADSMKCFPLTFSGEMHCKVKVLWFCLVNRPEWFIILLPIFHVLLSDYYYYFNVEPRCVSGDIFVYLWAPTQGHSKWGMILLPLSPLAPWL